MQNVSCFFLDLSGSIFKSDIDQYVDMVRTIGNHYNVEDIVVSVFSCRIDYQIACKLENFGNFDMNMVSRGGTNFIHCENLINVIEPEYAFFLSDGEGMPMNKNRLGDTKVKFYLTQSQYDEEIRFGRTLENLKKIGNVYEFER